MSRTIVRALLVAAAAAVGSLTVASTGAGAVVPMPCPPGIPAAERDRVECGRVQVPLRYDRPDAPPIEIAFTRIRAAAPAAPDPVILLAGGPGEKLITATGSFLAPRSPFRRITQGRDLVLLDQRGVGLSRPALECPEVDRAGAAGTSDDVAALLVRCAARLRAEGNDLSAYSTANNVRDLDVLRRELGYDAVNLLGVSYGARLAQQALRGDPAWIRSVVLSSPIPAGANFVADGPRSFGQALSRTFRLCAAAAACRTRYPALSRTLDAAIMRLARRPAVVPVTSGGRTVRVPVTAGLAATVLFASYYSPRGVAQVPGLISALGRGQYAALLRGSGLDVTSGTPVSLGMQLSFLCQEEAPRIRGSAVARARSLAPAPRAIADQSIVIGRPLQAICRRWGVPPTTEPTFSPVASEVPALVVTGQLDQITPARYGGTVARQLPNSTLVQVPGAGHSPLFAAGPCGVRATAAFFDDPSAPPPVACLRRGGGS